MYPNNRNRRLRKSPAIRDLVRENELTTNDLMLPIFIAEGSQIKELIPSMPGCYRLSLDLLLEELKSVSDLGIKALLLFVKVDDALKDNKGTAAIAPDGLMQRAVKTIKDAFPDLLIMTDVL
jgi:porphobilinogen synthase